MSLLFLLEIRTLIFFLLLISYCTSDSPPDSNTGAATPFSPKNKVCGTFQSCHHLCHHKAFHPSLSGSSVFFACDVHSDHNYEVLYCGNPSQKKGSQSAAVDAQGIDVPTQRILCSNAGGRLCGQGNRTRCLLPNALYGEYNSECVTGQGLVTHGRTFAGHVYSQAFRLAGCEDYGSS
ncbi:hypothetical protein VTN77DRAFT_8762 [Rasamsonia byssochlamydoides]|uniref:uncharacterized protein n=1 Tax=Rasamsonia byssochlamydoides TaxID=89139 RepID=UPI003742B111